LQGTNDDPAPSETDLHSKRDVEPVGNYIDVDAPTTEEVVRSAFARMILANNRSEDARLRLNVARARLLRRDLETYDRQGILTPEDQQLLSVLRPFVDGWAAHERAAWRAPAAREHQALAHRKPSVRSEPGRGEPRGRESRPTRGVRTAAATRGDPSGSDPDPEPDQHLVRAAFRPLVHAALRPTERRPR
jgi:hypothetical protein